MLSGVGMADIAVGEARWNGLVRQTAFLPRTTINANVDSRWPSRAFKHVAITQQLENSAPLQSELVGAFIRRVGTKHNLNGLKYNLRECGRSSRVTH